MIVMVVVTDTNEKTWKIDFVFENKYIACCSIVLTDNVFNFASICEKNILPTELRNQNMKPKFFDSRERKCSLLLKVMWNPLLMSLRKNQSKFGNWLTNHILNHEVCSPPFFFDL